MKIIIVTEAITILLYDYCFQIMDTNVYCRMPCKKTYIAY